jgi:glycerophosphoryl diester phosphodiesterase
MNPEFALRLMGVLLWAGFFTQTGLAQNSPAWTQTAVLAAPEAIQAAAADDEFVYAVNNTLVAKYDRNTGERLATSTGEANHLNSGFFWEGRLYCAHSNYPRKPEQSEIKVLDPQTMELTTFKDFGNFGGSLTWAIRRGDSWWCNFAHYGDDNAQTFLAEFDDQWQELGRWTYPPDVIRELGAYSLSGGVWRGDSLLVTGHDHGVLYRLRIPSKGRILHFVEKQRAPFTGQGIAADPRTGGLVGIDRVKRLVVFAVPPRSPRLRVVAHRGLLLHAPENTLAAFRACLELRIGFEFDVRRSKDGVLVCVHDESLDRTTTGRGKVADLTLQQLKQLDAGSWFDPAFQGEAIPTVEEILALLAEYRSRPVLVCVDLKTEDEQVESEVVALAQEHRVLDRLLFIGRAISEPAVRRRLRHADPKTHVAALANNPDELPAALADADSNWAYLRFVPSREEAARIREAGKQIFIAGPPVAGKEMANWQAATLAGADGILTDYPLELMHGLRNSD